MTLGVFWRNEIRLASAIKPAFKCRAATRSIKMNHRSSDEEPRLIGAQKAQALFQVLTDTAACGLRRRASDDAEVPLVSELLGLEWVRWQEDGRLCMTSTGEDGCELLRRHLRAATNSRTSFQFPG